MREFHVDWICPIIMPRKTDYKYHLDKAEQCRPEGLEVWAYTSCSTKYPNPNFFINFPLIESRVIWWLAYQQKMDGFLFWALNFWARESDNDCLIDPVKDGPFIKWNIESHKIFYGDGTLIYPGIDGPIGTIRLANIRDGLEDYEYLWMLSNQAGDIDTGRKACRPITTGVINFTRDPKTVYDQRDAIAGRLKKYSIPIPD